jgi:hypothetical protein
VIYAYGICEPAATGAALRRRGLGGARLRVLECQGLAAVYSRHRSFRPRPLPKLVFGHERVVEAIMAGGAVLPLRFGTQLEREGELEEVLSARHDELRRSLERVRGKVELAVRIFAERARPGRGMMESTGRGYLLARVDAHRRYEHVSREVHAALVPLSAASRVRQPRSPQAILAAAYLVESDQVDHFRRQADRLGCRHLGTQIMLTGPWPPYNFAMEQP